MAYNFNGTNQYLSANSAVVSAAPLTMCCFFNPPNTTDGSVLLSITGNGTTGNTRFAIVADGGFSGDPLTILASNTANQTGFARTTNSYVANQWQHAAAVFSSNTNRSVYLNASGLASNATDITPSSLVRTNIGVQFIAGAGGTAGAGFAKSMIAEVGIWNAALTAAEVASLADGMTCDKIRPQNLVFYAPLVRDLIDAKGGRAITNNNGATVAPHPRIYP